MNLWFYVAVNVGMFALWDIFGLPRGESYLTRIEIGRFVFVLLSTQTLAPTLWGFVK